MNLDKILEYFNVEEDDGVKYCQLKTGYLLRYGGFGQFDIRAISIDEHDIYFSTTEDRDWKEPINIAYDTLRRCNLYKEIPFDIKDES